ATIRARNRASSKRSASKALGETPRLALSVIAHFHACWHLTDIRLRSSALRGKADITWTYADDIDSRRGGCAWGAQRVFNPGQTLGQASRLRLQRQRTTTGD